MKRTRIRVTNVRGEEWEHLLFEQAYREQDRDSFPDTRPADSRMVDNHIDCTYRHDFLDLSQPKLADICKAAKSSPTAGIQKKMKLFVDLRRHQQGHIGRMQGMTDIYCLEQSREPDR